MTISETKMQMVIANYFKDECDVNTSIRQAFEKGFRIGVKKGASMHRPQEWIPCSEKLPTTAGHYLCSFKKPKRIDNIYVELAYWTGSRWYGYLASEINAWMQLPEPWKGTDDESIDCK